LGGVDRGGGAVVDHAKRGNELASVDVGRLVNGGQGAGNVTLVVRVEQAVAQDVAQDALIEIVMGVDEAGNDDSVGGVDHRGRVGRDVGPDLADLAVLDQQVGLREVADRAVEGEHHAALDKDAAL